MTFAAILWGLYSAMDIQEWGGGILIKWTVLLTHLWQATVLPAGSYDDDDILTESP